MAKKKDSNKAGEDQQRKQILWRWMLWIVMAGAWLLLLASMVSHHPADPPAHAIEPYNAAVRNWVGPIGAFVSYEAYLMLGPGVWALMAAGAVALIVTASGRGIAHPTLRVIGAVLMAVGVSAWVVILEPTALGQMMLHRLPQAWQLNLPPEKLGGLLALFLVDELHVRFGPVGVMVVVTVGLCIGSLLAIDEIVLALPRVLMRLCGMAGRLKMPAITWPWKKTAAKKPSVRGGVTMDEEADAETDTASRKKRSKTPIRAGGRVVDGEGADEAAAIDESAGGFAATESFGIEPGQPGTDADAEVPAELDEDESESETETEAEDDEDGGANAPAAYVEQKRLTAEELREKFKTLPINFAPQRQFKTPPPREVDLSGYRFPEIATLEEPESNFNDEMAELVREQAASLTAALNQYRIEGEVVGIDTGPVITLFEVRLAPGTKVAQINNVSSDVARALRSQNIRVVPNTAGKDTIGIEVPNLRKEKVRLKELMSVGADSVKKMALPMFLGKDASGEPLIADLTAMPHMLIAGTTGSGKSVCMNSIIMSFLFTKRPDELKLVLVDPKMVEMSQFKDIPHLMCPVVTDMGKAAAILEWAVTKMDERYELLAEAGVRDITSYNNLGWDQLKERMNPQTEEEEARIPKKLPLLVFVIDELADLMMTNKEVEGFIVRIAQKARAVGLHLILATQRPQANVVTGLIKSNMPCRVAFKVASGMDSRIVLDQKGAELLLGQGDMLFLSPRTSKLTRAQGTLVDDLEIRMTVKFLKSVAMQQFEPQLVQIKQPGMEEASGERDPLFEDAVRIVLESQRGSVSLLQRRLTVGYSRASRLIEQIAEAGIIGTYKGSQAREVNMTLDEWEALREQAAESLAQGGVSGGASGEQEEMFDDDADIDQAREDEAEEATNGNA
ncbi:MAG: DNA translocase FtsK 4TM domain-containing protein [Phycisphaeraceae bacterium]|nr:DNA translocase FtsK 4TM domain-containing protein [Phycisphaeraceae bacterium]